jgi:FkbM family methyltransferase
MSTRSLIVKLLDRPGFRPVLAGLISKYAGRLQEASEASEPLRVFYDQATGCWGRAHGEEWLVEAPQFPYYANDLQLRSGKSPWQSTTLQHWMSYAVPRAGDTVLDIGAEVGNDSLTFAAHVGPTGKVLAVEAHPITYGRLYRTVVLSGLSQIVPVCAAIWDGPGIVAIESGESSVDSSVVLPDAHAARRAVHTVATITIDSLCDAIEGEISLIKMNIEGSEGRALGGMLKVLARTRNIVVACHDFRADAGEGEWFRTKSIVTRALQNAGFQILPNPHDGSPDPYVRDFVYARCSD